MGNTAKSWQIANPITELHTGFNTYRVQPIIMKGKRVEEVFDNINAKMTAGLPLTKEDLVPLTLCTIMGGEMPLKDRVIQAFAITNSVRETIPEAEKIEAVVYAMAEKFMDSVTIEQLKEAVGMTRLGQMMYNDGIEEGMKQGIEQGIESTQIKIASNLLNDLPDEIIAEKTGLSLEKIKELGEVTN